jgi:Holliday junction resolvase-like predicted endonuclease
VLQKALKLRELIARYGAMRRLDGFTPHSRGTELNRLIADGLDCYGIRANASARQGYGEIDVTFAVEGTRFVLEAKWEQDKTDTGKISKLKTRVEQRLTNTVGVFMSMAGYSPEAIRDVNIGRRLEVLLIDRSHLEAMISGVVPPTELFGLLIDKASYEGRPYYALEELLPRPAAEPVVGFGAPEGLDDLVRTARPGVIIEPLLHDLPMESIGLASLAANELILNYSEGLVRVDLGRQAAEWHAALPTSYGHTLPMGDGSLLFRRQSGVGALRDGQIHGLAGGFVGNAILFSDEDGNAWALDHGGYTHDNWPEEGVNAALVRLGNELGDQMWTPTTIRGGLLADAVWIDQDRIAAVGSGVLEVINPHTGANTRHLHELSNTMSLSKLGDEIVLTVANGNIVAVLGLDGRTVLPLAELNLSGSISELCPAGDGSFLMFSTYSTAPPTIRGIVLRVRLPHDLLTLTA